ncbi:MAG TPA: mevalonate kinase [Candidatus Thalassarchaeaceae archaeon]|nr:mevalonate kinase [Candidatus Thalassarchaeaceae archaeon]|tara:strand:- start:829 stop:1800 length:972 start_codon:yes stop_codon:yes gene_type:complete
MTSAFAPGKCILFGEHAVVFGHPAVAVAIDQGVRVSVTESEDWFLEGKKFQKRRHPHISHILENVFQYDGPPLCIDVHSSLFSAAGMGSSAALSNALAAAIQSHLLPDEPLDRISLAKIAHSAEANAQKGRASPTDTATSALGGCIVVSEKQVDGTRHVFDTKLDTPEGLRRWTVSAVDIPSDVEESWLVIGYTGKGSSTGSMVAKVADLVSRNPGKMDQLRMIGQITKAGLTALSAGNLEALGMAMDTCHQRLQDLEVSNNKLDMLVLAARPHSLGAKMTGAGGGGCMIALTRDPKRTSEAIEVAGGTPLISRLGSNGVSLV